MVVPQTQKQLSKTLAHQCIHVVLFALLVGGVSACQTISIDDINLNRIQVPEVSFPSVNASDIPGVSEFVANTTNYPLAENAPERPTDTKSLQYWDQSVRDILAEANDVSTGFEPASDTLSPEQISQNIDVLIERAEAYKIDDPETLSD